MRRREFLAGTAAIALATVIPVARVRELPEGVYALKGETITCETGHPIATFAKNVRIGERWDIERQLTDWQQAIPDMGGFPTCEECGARFWAGVAVHFNDGWRYENNGRLRKRPFMTLDQNLLLTA